MNKIFSIAIICSLGLPLFGTEPALENIYEAIKESDLDEVKSQWKRIGRYHSVDEQREALKKLVDKASDVLKESKSSASAEGGIDYAKFVPGVILRLAGAGILAYCLKWQYVDRNLYREDLPVYYTLLGTSLACSLGGQYLTSAGWKGTEVQQGSSSPSRLILTYLEKRLDELQEQKKAQ